MGTTSNHETRMALSNFGVEFSSRLPTADVRIKPEVVAPRANLQGPVPGGGYSDDAYADGASFAAPHVAGVGALILEQYPNLSPLDVRRAIVETARKLLGVRTAPKAEASWTPSREHG